MIPAILTAWREQSNDQTRLIRNQPSFQAIHPQLQARELRRGTPRNHSESKTTTGMFSKMQAKIADGDIQYHSNEHQAAWKL
jgi:hypothetical protein